MSQENGIFQVVVSNASHPGGESPRQPRVRVKGNKLVKAAERRIPESAEADAPFALTGLSDARARYADFMLMVMIALAILSQFYRSSNGVIAPELMHELNVDAGDIGWSSGSFFVIFALLQIPIGVLFDRYGVRRVVSTMLIFAIAGTCLFSVAQSAGLLVAGRFLIGLGFAGGMAGSLVVLSRWHDASSFTRAMTLLFAFANIGSLLATMPLALATEWVGWRPTFLALGVITGLVAVVYFAVVRDTPDDGADRAPRTETLADSIRGIGELFRVPGLLKVMPMIAIGYASIVTIVGLWGGPYLHDVYDVDGVQRGNLLSIMAVALVVGTLAYGPLRQRAGRFRPVVIGGSLVSAMLMLVLAAVVSAPIWLTVGLLIAICLIGAYSVVLMAHGVALIPAKLAGRGTTTLNAVLMGGTALLQIASGEIIRFVQGWAGGAPAGYTAFFLLLGALTLGAAAIYHRSPEPPADRGR